MCKYVFFYGHERSDVLEDENNFLTKIEDLRPYMVKFEENSAMKPKIYLFDCEKRGDDGQPIIVITHDECTFFANDGIQRV